MHRTISLATLMLLSWFPPLGLSPTTGEPTLDRRLVNWPPHRMRGTAPRKRRGSSRVKYSGAKGLR